MHWNNIDKPTYELLKMVLNIGVPYSYRGHAILSQPFEVKAPYLKSVVISLENTIF